MKIGKFKVVVEEHVVPYHNFDFFFYLSVEFDRHQQATKTVTIVIGEPIGKERSRNNI